MKTLNSHHFVQGTFPFSCNSQNKTVQCSSVIEMLTDAMNHRKEYMKDIPGKGKGTQERGKHSSAYGEGDATII